ncbi:MAG: outer membrane protein assembly factor BamB [Burkholderiaceae bacterium]|jgi:outer membrane assembly lipoprotein YfgL|nr:outer membrane protein assembly factor BamB [Burkholderiaceae bacterium]
MMGALHPLAHRWAAVGAATVWAVALLGGCASGSDRPKPADLPPNPAVIGVRQVWSARLSPIDFPLQAQARGERVVLATGSGAVVTLDAATGRQLARADVGAPLSAGVGSDGTVSAVVTQDNEAVAVEQDRVLWRHRLASQSFTPPLVAGGRVFVLGADRSLSALDGRTGRLLWSVPPQADALVLRQNGLLMAVGNTLVAGLSGRLTGLDPDTGSVRWEAPVAAARGANDVERLIDLVGGVARQGSVVCARAFQSAVGCVDAAGGNLLWSKPADGATGLAGDGERVFGVEADGKVIAWNTAGGERLWLNESLRWRTLTGPLVLGRSAVVGDSGSGQLLLLARTDGKLLERMGTDSSGLAAAPVAAANTLVAVTRAGGVYGFQPE